MEKLTRSILIKLLENIDKKSIKETHKSLNHLPEYYLNVKLSDELYKKGYGFELEKPASEVATDLKIDIVNIEFDNSEIENRILNGRVDLVVTTREKRSLRNLIELKIGTKESKLKLDVDRLVWFSQRSEKKSIQRSFLIFSTSKTTDSISNMIHSLGEYYEELTFKHELFTSKQPSTREKSEGKDVSIVVLEIKK
jgi:hypothetical protein